MAFVPANGGRAPAEGLQVPGSRARRGAATRARIIEAARGQFAAHGYQRTTIRAVAAQAGVDPSLVMRYYDSKAGLFTSVSTANLHPPDLQAVPTRRLGEVLVRHFLDRWEGGLNDDTLAFLLRTAVTDDTVAARLRETFAQVIAQPLAVLGISDPETRAALAGTQLLGLVLCRYILRIEPVASLPADDVVALIAPNVQRSLTAPLTPRPPKPAQRTPRGRSGEETGRLNGMTR